MVELLRLFVVVFFAGIGYELGGAAGHRVALGPFDGLAIGVIVGSGVGFVLGGVLGRSTVSAVNATEAALREVSADTLVAGAVGGVVGVIAGSAVAWPLFLIRQALVAVPLFCFVVAVCGLLGQRIGAGRRDAVVALLGQRGGVVPRPVAATAGPLLLDTSVAVDGRVVDVVRAGFLPGPLLVCLPVVDELQALADSHDDSRRIRGRRGLDVLQTLKREPSARLEVIEDPAPELAEVDAKLVRGCLDRRAALLTLDTNLARAAAITGVTVANLHALAIAMRPPVAAGDSIRVHLLKPGKEAGQAVGYLDDGTMVVAEGCRGQVGKEADVRVVSVLVTANGRMVFAEPAAAGP